MKKKKTNYLKYEFGTMIDNPYSDLANNQISMAKASLKAQNNPWAKGLNMLGNMAIQYGTSMMNKGSAKGQGVSEGGTDWGSMLGQGVGALGSVANSNYQMQSTNAYGGKTGVAGANVEGEEVIETPNGQVAKMKGPSHENGGIDIQAPIGTEVFSKRLKGSDGKTMADRKIKREKDMGRAIKLLEENPSDIALKNLYKKTRQSTEIEEASDMAQMQFAKTMSEMTDMFMYGGKVGENPKYDLGGNIGEDPYAGALYSRGYGVSQFQPYLSNYGADPLTQNPNWGDVNNRKAFQKLVGTKEDGIFGPDTLAKAQSYYKDRQPVEKINMPDNGNIVANKVNMPDILNPNIDYTGIEQKFENPGISDDARLGDVTNRTYQGPMTEAGAVDPNAKEGEEGSWWDRNMADQTSGITMGDMVGMAGDLYSTFKPMKNTLANRASDTPNVNAFANYGKDALNKLDESKQFQNDVRDSALGDLELNRNASIKRGRNSARSVNTMRALDLATDMGVNQAKSQIYNNFAQAMQGILTSEAGAMSDRDAHVMQGEQNRDLADRQDKDNFYTQMGKDIATKGTGLQKIGYDLNQIKKRNVSTKLVNELSDNFDIDNSGNVTSKSSGSITSQSEYTKLPKEKKATFKEANESGYNVTVKNGKLVYTGTDVEYDPKKPDKKYNRRR